VQIQFGLISTGCGRGALLHSPLTKSCHHRPASTNSRESFGRTRIFIKFFAYFSPSAMESFCSGKFSLFFHISAFVFWCRFHLAILRQNFPSVKCPLQICCLSPGLRKKNTGKKLNKSPEVCIGSKLIFSKYLINFSFLLKCQVKKNYLRIALIWC